MDEKINNIIPTLMGEIESDQENESKELLDYYMCCNSPEKAVVNNIMMYLCGWTFPTILEMCGIKVDEKGEPLVGPNPTSLLPGAIRDVAALSPEA